VTHDYRTGDIVRRGDNWGVVRRSRSVIDFGGPHVDWWVGQYAAGQVEHWFTQRTQPNDDLSAPFDVNYAGIPEEVIARSMAIILTEDV
jgi:hypothetical protein